jgi:hypothetical protein
VNPSQFDTLVRQIDAQGSRRAILRSVVGGTFITLLSAASRLSAQSAPLASAGAVQPANDTSRTCLSPAPSGTSTSVAKHSQSEDQIGVIYGNFPTDACLEVAYDAVDGLAIREGDIIMGTAEEMRAARCPDQPKSSEDSPLSNPEFRQSLRWLSGIIPFRIDPSITSRPDVLDRVNAAVEQWNISSTPVCVIPLEAIEHRSWFIDQNEVDVDHYVLFKFNSSEEFLEKALCTSWVGRQTGKNARGGRRSTLVQTAKSDICCTSLVTRLASSMNTSDRIAIHTSKSIEATSQQTFGITVGRLKGRKTSRPWAYRTTSVRSCTTHPS